MTDNKTTGFDTLAVHSGFAPDPRTGAVTPPVFQTSTYVQQAVAEPFGHYEYARTANPTREALETSVSTLEGGRHGIAFGSGCAATTTAVHLMKSGDLLLSADDVYGGTYRIFRDCYTQFGLDTAFMDLTDTATATAAIAERKPRWVWIETPSNPLLKIIDIEAVVAAAHHVGAKVMVDNTFASPCFQNPLALGADAVLHSTTKYLGGHADVVGGIIVTNDDAIAERLRYLQNALGAVPGPWDCWLTLRGVRTLGLRMARHAESAGRIAEHLSGHNDVAMVRWPGLTSHPGHEIAARQMSGFSGMVSFELKGGLERAKRFVESTGLFLLAESLGGVESLIEVPALMTHAAVPAAERRKSGIADGLIRLSVGIEACDDLIADLDRAFHLSRKD